MSQTNPDMAKARYYPTVTLLEREDPLNPQLAPWVVVTGGTADTGCNCTTCPNENTYEVFDLATNQWQQNSVTNNFWFDGPAVSSGAFTMYPRIVPLTVGAAANTSYLFHCGWEPVASRKDHASAPTGPWTGMAMQNGAFGGWRVYGSAVLMPNLNANLTETVMVFGGQLNGLGQFDAQWCRASAVTSGAWPNGFDWLSVTSMSRVRDYPNAVLLPDGTILAMHGKNPNIEPGPIYAKEPEQFVTNGANGAWIAMPAEESPRTYHATALLLPSGRVLSAGGNERTWDYQIFSPPYMTLPVMAPTITGTPPTALQYDPNRTNPPYTISYETSGDEQEIVARVVLMRPGSVTHHFDQDQRYHQLEIVSVTDTAVTFRAPRTRFEAPRGNWMLFLVNQAGAPSSAHWVTL